MTCSSRFFHSNSLLRELFPALHRDDDGGDSPPPSPSADRAPEIDQEVIGGNNESLRAGGRAHSQDSYPTDSAPSTYPPHERPTVQP